MDKLMSVVTVSVPSDIKEDATNLFNSLGLDMNTAINIFLKRAIFERGIPFEVSEQPYKEFFRTLKELDYIENHKEKYKTYHDVDKMFEDILLGDRY